MNSWAKSDEDQKLQDAITYLEGRKSYLAAEVARLGHPYVGTRGGYTACVGVHPNDPEDLIFNFNRNFLGTLTVEQTAFVLAHEAMHVVLGHTNTIAQWTAHSDEARRFNIAADCVINDLLVYQFKLTDMPTDAMRGEEIVGFRCDRLSATEVMSLIATREVAYSHRRNIKEAADKAFGQVPTGNVAGQKANQAAHPHREWSKIDSEAIRRVLARAEKSLEGKARALKQKREELAKQIEEQVQKIAEAKEVQESKADEEELEDAETEVSAEPDDGDLENDETEDEEDFEIELGLEDEDDLGEIEDLQAQLAEMQEALDELDSDESAFSNSMPGRGAIGRVRDPEPKNPLEGPWKQEIEKRFRTLHKHKDVWRRQPRTLISVYPDVILPNREMDHKPWCVVAIDVSGSMSANDIKRCKATLDMIPKICDVTLLSFDGNVYELEYTPGQKLSTVKLRGGGGTNFQAVAKYVSDKATERKKYPDFVIVFTDGFCSSPTIQPEEHESRWVWVITECGSEHQLLQRGYSWSYRNYSRNRSRVVKSDVENAPKWAVVLTA